MNEVEAAKALTQPETPVLIKFIAENWLNIIFGVIGAIGTALAVLSWKNSQKDKRSYKFLLDLAEKNIEKNITEEQLREKKEEVEEAALKIERLQEQIKKEIPIEAKKAVLKDKLNSQYIELTSAYKNVQSIKEEIGTLGETAEIPPDLLKEIEKEISPEYLLKEERENLKTYLTVFTTLSAITSTLTSAFFPWQVSRMLAGLFLLAGFVILIQLIRNIFKSASRKNQVRISTYGYIIGLIAAVMSGIGALFIYVEYGRSYYTDIGTYFVIGVIGVVSFGLFIFAMKLRNLKMHLSNSSN